MKGFTKDGKFRPTGRTKSSLKKSDIRKKETMHTIENNIITSGSPMYEEYLEEYPDSIISRDVRSFGKRGTHGSFGYYMMIGDYGEAWWRADRENQEKMLELGFGTKYLPDFDNEMTPKRLHDILENASEDHTNTTREKHSIDTEFKKGEIVMVSSDNDNDGYDEFRNKKLRITHVATNQDEHQGFDEGLAGSGLYDLETLDGKEVPFSLYDYELESA